ncbi:MAG: hypothetical protein FJY79_02330 [Candidatus Aminicenantes bacterium]|nr:hypothetical protein [Candidatus Aminicenantes bacterium]
MKFLKTVLPLAALLLAVACASSFYESRPKLNYYRGPNVPEGYIKVLRASVSEIEFEIRVEFAERQLYHLVLEGNEPVAEGWFPTIRAGMQYYTVTMKPRKGLQFEVGKTYRLCIGSQNPEQLQLTSVNYPCRADFEFVFEEKL